MALNCYLAAFKISMDCTKKRPNDNLIPFVCEVIFRLEIITIANTG